VILEDKDIIQCVALFNKYTRASVPTYPIPLSDEDKQLLIDRVYGEYARYTSDNTDKSIVAANKDYFTYSDFVKVIWKVFRDNLPSPTMTEDIQPSEPITPGKYGMLYNLFAATDNRIMAPNGWHVPTTKEWEEVFQQLDPLFTLATGSSDPDFVFKLMDVLTWISFLGTDEYELSFTSCGSRAYDGTFYSSGSLGTWWGSSLYSVIGMFDYTGFDIFSDGTIFPIDASVFTDNDKRSGCAIRWVKDNSVYVDTVTGNDGTVYYTKQVGSKIITKSDVIETKYRNGDDIELVNDNTEWSNSLTGARCLYPI
jgi:uncharacterized protein (TIGR02145 family)